MVKRQMRESPESTLASRGSVVRTSGRGPEYSTVFAGSPTKKESNRETKTVRRSLFGRVVSGIAVILIGLAVAFAVVYAFSDQIGEILPSLKPQLVAINIAVKYILIYVGVLASQAWAWIMGLIGG